MAGALAKQLTGMTDLTWPGMARLPNLVGSIGLTDFESELLAFFDNLVGAEHCLIFQMKNYELLQVASISSPDATAIPKFCKNNYGVMRRLRQLGQNDLRVETYSFTELNDLPIYIVARPKAVVLMGSRHNSFFYVRVIKSRRTEFTESELSSVREIADLLISLIGRHQDIVSAKPIAYSALTSLETIEERILSTQKLSSREAQVCARILYGCSSCEIASALGIGKESVMTYRKRAYQHLEINSQRELLLWYLSLGQKVVCN